MRTVEQQESQGEGSENGRGEVSGVRRPDLVKEIHIRIPLHIAIPILALFSVAVVVLLFGLFLLKLPKEHAPAVALALSVNILAAATFAAAQKKLNGTTIAQLCVMIVYPVLLAVVLVNLGGFGTIPEEAAATEGEAAPVTEEEAVVELSAANLEFSKEELVFPADEDVTLTFDNQDSAPHNFSIYKDDTLDEDFFIGSNVEPGGVIDYEIPALAAGPYYFRCDLHPSMEGRVLVE